MDKNKKALFIFGPTASGKTAFAEKLAQYIPAEIINTDSAQMYVPLSVGTAKPDWRSGPCAQHLFDIINEPRRMSVHTYRTLAEQKMKEIHARDRLPIFVGGSGFYVKSLFFSLISDTVLPQAEADTLSHAKNLWDTLYAIDEVRARQIHPHDTYRLKRALEIWQATGQKPSLYQPLYAPLAPWTILHITRKRDDLYKTIDARVLQMIRNGWLDEVKQLIQTCWESFVYEKGFIGYAELIDYYKHIYTLEQSVAIIQQRTRNYAKRQETFWRMLKKEIVRAEKLSGDQPAGTVIEFDMTHPDDAYIKKCIDDSITLMSE